LKGSCAALAGFVAGATAMLHIPLHACMHVRVDQGIGCNASLSIPTRLHFSVCMLRMHPLSHERSFDQRNHGIAGCCAAPTSGCSDLK
jgi:hypothetical protein